MKVIAWLSDKRGILIILLWFLCLMDLLTTYYLLKMYPDHFREKSWLHRFLLYNLDWSLEFDLLVFSPILVSILSAILYGLWEWSCRRRQFLVMTTSALACVCAIVLGTLVIINHALEIHKAKIFN